jgi:hypothetical protein
MSLLKLAPNQIVKFESFPSDWRKLVGAKPEYKAVETHAAQKVITLEKREYSPTDEAREVELLEEDDSLSKREEELLLMTNGKIKDLIESKSLELPNKVNKVNLVNVILEAEAKG